MVYSEDVFYNCDTDECVSLDDLTEMAEEQAWDDFDPVDYLGDRYNNMAELWDEVSSEGVDGVRELLWDARRDEVYNDVMAAMDDADDYGAFVVCGDTIKLMNVWGVVF